MHLWLLVARETLGRGNCFLVRTRLIFSILDDGHRLRDNCMDIETGDVVVVREPVAIITPI